MFNDFFTGGHSVILIPVVMYEYRMSFHNSWYRDGTALCSGVSVLLMIVQSCKCLVDDCSVL